MKNRAVCVFVCLALCLLGAGTAVFAQSDVASVTGRVLDPNGAIIIEATVTAKNVDTGVATVVRTNQEGIYSFANLQPGNYEFTVSKHGFKGIVKTGVTLHLADTISMNFNMVVGEITEKVTVEAGALTMNTTNAAVSTVVDQSYIKNMPLNGRTLQDLILLTPGVVTQTPQNNLSTSGNGAMGEFSVNGQRPESNYYTVDGVSANTGINTDITGAGVTGSVASSTALGTTQALVSVDELQEFRVQSSTYSAEYGRNPGGQFAFETKSGTNLWHGTAYDYVRNDIFDATDYFTHYLSTPQVPLTKTAVRQNDFGGTLGGAVRIPGLYNGKDKTFFFVSYEGLRLRSPQQPGVSYVPDASLRANAPSPLNQALNAFPVPNGGNVMQPCVSPTDPGCVNGLEPSGMARFIGGFSNPSTIDSTSVRLDHIIRKTRLFFRFNDTSSDVAIRQTGPFVPVPSVLATTSSSIRTYTSGVTSAFSDRVANDLRLNYTSNENAGDSVIDAFAGSVPVDLGQLSGTGAGSRESLTLAINGQVSSLFQGKNSAVQRQWNLVDTVSVALGRHQFKFGADYRRLTPIVTPYLSAVDFQYFSESKVLANSSNNTQDKVSTAYYPLYKNFSVFAEDEWKASQHLNLSLGLRWEVNPAPGVTQGLMPYAIVGTNLNNWVSAPQGTPLWRTTWYNFAPRLGAAYVLRDQQGWETVIRVGGGIFFDTAQQLGSGGFGVQAPGFFASVSSSTSFPNLPTPGPVIQNPPDPNACADSGCISLFGFTQHLQLPYTTQWNFSLEQAMGKPRSLTLSYVGSHAGRLLRSNGYFPQSNPQAGFINMVQNGLTSDFSSAQVQFNQRLSHGLTSLASYTWSHCIDYGSQNYVSGYQRGDCDYDVRHNFSAALSYDVPNIGRGRILSALINHWGIDDRLIARTAFPVTLVSFIPITLPDGSSVDQGLSLTGKPVYVYGSQCNSIYATDFGNTLPCPGGRAINPDAFTNATNCSSSNPNCYGNAPRNFVRGFGAWQMNMAVRREFPIHERLTLQFRAEAFNIFNHTNLGAIDPFFGDPTFGQAISTLAHSWDSASVLSSLYQMGGARSMQFALKLVF